MRGLNRTRVYCPGVIACLAITLLASGCQGLRCGTAGLGPQYGAVEGDLVGECGCDSGCGDSGCGECGCGECGDVAFPSTCGSCGTGGCGGISGLFLPLMSTKLACGSGCGGVYWGEWMNDPPACCDPCTDCGCWVEPRCCGHQGLLSRCWDRIHQALHVGMYGYRPGDCCGDCGGDCGGAGCSGCESCGGGTSFDDGVPIEELPMGTVSPAEITHQIRQEHGRSPHPLVSRRMRR